MGSLDDLFAKEIAEGCEKIFKAKEADIEKLAQQALQEKELFASTAFKNAVEVLVMEATKDCVSRTEFYRMIGLFIVASILAVSLVKIIPL